MTKIISLLTRYIIPNDANKDKVKRWVAMLPFAGPQQDEFEDRRVVAVYRSIQSKGMINPLLVHDCNANGIYTVAIGHQRLAALKALGWPTCEGIVIRDRGEIQQTIDKHYTPYIWCHDAQDYIKA